MSWNRHGAIVVAGLALSSGCSWDGLDPKEKPNRAPTVEITGGAVEGRNASYRVEFFWFGTDADGAIDHFLVAIDDTCLCTIIDTIATNPVVLDTTKSFDKDECVAAGLEPAYESASDIWTRVNTFSGSFAFDATTPIPPIGGTGAFEAQDWHTFYIKAVDDRGAQSRPDSRYFNAVTIAPTVRILAPVGRPPNNAALVSSFFNVRWSGRDEDSSESSRKPRGYQLKLVPIPSVQNTSDQQAIDAVVNPFVLRNHPNTLIPAELVVPVDATGVPLADVTDSTYLPWDWYPKKDTPYPDELLRFRNTTPGDYAFAVRPVDQAGAVMPREAFKVANDERAGNVIKIDINANLPVNPYITITERNLLGQFGFIADGQIWRVEVPVNVPLDFEWTATADHYGGRVAGINYALDIADPGCEVCQSSDGVGGWIGWGGHQGFRGDIVFSDEQAGEQHVLYVRARDESFSAEREILAVVVMDVISFDFDRTALLIDDFIVSGYDDCRHDAIITPMVRHAIEPHLQFEEELAIFAGHAPGQTPCSESSQPRTLKLSTLARYKLLYWPVSGQGAGSVLGSVTPHPNYRTDTERYLSIYMQAGGNLIVWGRNSTGHLLGDFFPSDAYLPELPSITNPNYGPGTFLWDVMQIRARSDVVGRGTSRLLSAVCSGIIGMRATPKARAEGFPVGAIDPTGYVDSSGLPRTAIWYERYLGANNPFGATANCVTGPPTSLRVAGMDTLYTYVSNSWTYEAAGPGAIRDACSTAFLSAFEGKPVLFRYKDPFGRQGKYVWLSTPLYVFAQDHTDDLHALMRKLTDWVLE